MPSSPKIQKSAMLETAFSILQKDGAEAVNIKNLAKEIGCSTQPISWQFGGMDGLRAELAEKVIAYASKKAAKTALKDCESNSPTAAFAAVGCAYLDLLYDEPNLIEFIRFFPGKATMNSIVSDENHKNLPVEIANELGVTVEDALKMMQSSITYVQGLSSMIMTGMLEVSRDTAKDMARDHGARYISSFGVPLEKVRKLLFG